MLPAAQGKHCLSCQKNVIDFTGMTDAELAAYFKTVKTPTCGRFTESQLQRDILIPQKSIPWLKYFFQFTFPAFLLSLKSNAQISKVASPIEALEKRPSPTQATGDQTIGGISGVITDASGIPLSGASILITNTKTGTVSDSAGNFYLSGIEPSTLLTISYIGFDTKEVMAGSLQKSSTIKLSQQLMGEVIIVGYTITAKSRRKKSKELRSQQLTTPSLLAYPNPIVAGNTLSIQCRAMEEGTYKAQLFTLFGQMVQNSDLDYSGKEKLISLPTAGMQAGTYLLRLQHQKTGKVLSQQVILRH